MQSGEIYFRPFRIRNKESKTMFNMNPWELIIILFIVLLIFGAKRLPEMGKSLGSGIREFKKSITSVNDDDDDDEKINSKKIDAKDSKE
jgi:sec-independent protein translocase protein TatA